MKQFIYVWSLDITASSILFICSRVKKGDKFSNIPALIGSSVKTYAQFKFGYEPICKLSPYIMFLIEPSFVRSLMMVRILLFGKVRNLLFGYSLIFIFFRIRSP